MPTVRTFPFDAVSGAPSYGAVAMRDVFQALATTGVVRNLDNELAVVASTPNAMTVEIQPGAALINGAIYRVAAGGGNVVLSVPANTSGSTRQDYVVLRYDLTTSPNDITAVYVTGTTSPPTLQRTSTRWELALAQVSVPNNATAIAQSNITDTRSNQSLCGIAYARSFPPVNNLEWPVPLTAGGTIKYVVAGVSKTYAPPSGSVAYVMAWYNGYIAPQSLAVGGVTVYGNLPDNEAVEFYRPFLVDSTISLTVPQSSTLVVYELPNISSITPVVTSVSSSSGYTVPSGFTLVILRLYSSNQGAWWLYDQAVGGNAVLVAPQPLVYGSGTTLSGSGYWQGYFVGSAGNFQVLKDPQPTRPVLVAGGRQVRANITSGVTIMGYLVPWAWTAATV